MEQFRLRNTVSSIIPTLFIWFRDIRLFPGGTVSVFLSFKLYSRISGPSPNVSSYFYVLIFCMYLNFILHYRELIWRRVPELWHFVRIAAPLLNQVPVHCLQYRYLPFYILSTPLFRIHNTGKWKVEPTSGRLISLFSWVQALRPRAGEPVPAGWAGWPAAAQSGSTRARETCTTRQLIITFLPSGGVFLHCSEI